MKELKIDVWSDVICPFCYLGKMKLEQAISKLGLHEQITMEWRSFQLDPGFPKNTSAPATEHLVKRKGISLEQIQTSQQRLTEQGKNFGIDFQFDRTINFNTFDAHRLLHWSKAFSKQHELKTALFKAHFTEGADLSKNSNLLRVIESVGLEAVNGDQVLNSVNYSQEAQHDIALAQQIGISGVPFFVFDQKTAISGAQADQVFEEVLMEMTN